MNVYFIGQGINSATSAGKIIQESLESPDFSLFKGLIAFVSMSGIKHLEVSIQEAKKNNLTFNLFVGVDQKGTSKEALEELLRLDIGTRVYWTKSPITYHPKIWIFEGDKRCRILIGSTNITRQGLFQNVEASLLVEFDKPDAQGGNVIKQIQDYYKSFFDGTDRNVQILTKELIDYLWKAKVIPDELERKQIHEKKQKSSEEKPEITKKLGELFPSITIQQPPKKQYQMKPPKQMIVKDAPSSAVTSRGKLIWKKANLPKSDVLYGSTGTNPTGGLRLVQAEWREQGKLIDQTKYFRQKVFGGLNWQVEKKEPFREIATAKFRIKILGVDKGEVELAIRHKPSGEAGQKNYTTLISWSGFSDTIRKKDLRGTDFYLYAPPKGKSEPFFVEITGEPKTPNVGRRTQSLLDF